MELKTKLLETAEKINVSRSSDILMTLNSKLSLNDAQLINMYKYWKKF